MDPGDISVKDANKKADELFTYYLGALTQARIINDLKYLSNLKQTFKLMLGIKEEAAAKA